MDFLEVKKLFFKVNNDYYFYLEEIYIYIYIYIMI